MPSLPAPQRIAEKPSTEAGPFWRTLAAAVRRKADADQENREDLLRFADLLEAFAEIE